MLKTGNAKTDINPKKMKVQRSRLGWEEGSEETKIWSKRVCYK